MSDCVCAHEQLSLECAECKKLTEARNAALEEAAYVLQWLISFEGHAAILGLAIEKIRALKSGGGK